MKSFKTHNQDGSEKECKFCHQHVWWNIVESRWYNPGGKQLDVETCELRREYFSEQAKDAAEARRH